jgi:hypothetical protein
MLKLSSIKSFLQYDFGGFKWFGPTKNMLSTIINGLFKLNYLKVCVKSDYAKAVAIAPTKFRDIIKIMKSWK